MESQQTVELLLSMQTKMDANQETMKTYHDDMLKTVKGKCKPQ
jgi:hypothetical protein